jgi:hypothetical protein
MLGANGTHHAGQILRLRSFVPASLCPMSLSGLSRSSTKRGVRDCRSARSHDERCDHSSSCLSGGWDRENCPL